MLVTGNSNGRVTFYDYQLRLLYWCESCDLDSIRWLSFDLQSNLLAPVFAIDVSESKPCFERMVERILISHIFKTFFYFKFMKILWFFSEIIEKS